MEPMELESGKKRLLADALDDSAPGLTAPKKPRSVEEGEPGRLLSALAADDQEVIRAIIAADPEALKSPNNAGQLPLHLACQHSGSVKLIHEMIEAYGGALSVADGQGHLPLHRAILNPTPANADIAGLLLTAAPGSALQTVTGTLCPVHFACSSALSAGVASVLLEANPDAIYRDQREVCTEHDIDGALMSLFSSACSNTGAAALEIVSLALEATPEPFRLDAGMVVRAACEHARADAVVMFLLRKFGCAVLSEQSTISLSLPLHILCENSSSPATVQEVVSMHYPALAARNDRGELPLHCACRNASSRAAEIVTIIMSARQPDGSASDTQTADLEALESPNDAGQLPLHLACQYSGSAELIREMLEAYAGALSVADEDNSLPLDHAYGNTTDAAPHIVRVLIEADLSRSLYTLPLHRVCQRSRLVANPDLVLQILSMYPDATKLDPGRTLPLHFCCRNAGSLKVVEELIKVQSGAVVEKDCIDDLPLHDACRNGSSCAPEIIRAVIAANPEALKSPNTAGQLPLHLACLHSGSVDVIREMIEAYGGALSVADRDMRCPFHLALSNSTNDAANIVHAVMEADQAVGTCVAMPASDYKAPSTGASTLPLITACKNSKLIAEPELILRMAALHPEALKSEHGSSKSLPLHLVCSQATVSVQLVQGLIEMYPEALAAKLDRYCLYGSVATDGNLPLHCACSKGCSAEVIRAIIAADPEALKSPNDAGQLPLHLACQHSGSVKLIHEMIEAYGGALSVADDQGHLTIHHSAKNSTNQAPAIVCAILAASPPDSLQKRNKDGDCALSCALRSSEDGNPTRLPQITLEMIKVFVNADRDGLLLKSRNKHGRSPVDICCRVESALAVEIMKIFTQSPSFDSALLNGNVEMTAEDTAEAREPAAKSISLHTACESSGSLQLVKLLIKLCPESLQLTTSGNTPVHCAAMNPASASFGMIQTLLSHIPGGAATVCIVRAQTDERGGRWPIMKVHCLFTSCAPILNVLVTLKYSRCLSRSIRRQPLNKKEQEMRAISLFTWRQNMLQAENTDKSPRLQGQQPRFSS